MNCRTSDATLTVHAALAPTGAALPGREALMPNRILRDGILRSEKISSLPPMAELFYRRLMSVVDDFGRYYANPKLLLSDCFPIRPSWADESTLSMWIEECRISGLIHTYEVNGTNFLEIDNFGQRLRDGQLSKFPASAEISRESREKTASRARTPSASTTASTTASEGKIEMTPSLDEQFQEFIRLYRIVGNPIDEDFANGSFCWRAWCVLDGFQRQQVVNSLQEREAAHAQVLHKPDNYITKGEYKRALRAPTNGSGRMSHADRVRQAIEEA